MGRGGPRATPRLTQILLTSARRLKLANIQGAWQGAIPVGCSLTLATNAAPPQIKLRAPCAARTYRFRKGSERRSATRAAGRVLCWASWARCRGLPQGKLAPSAGSMDDVRQRESDVG